MNALMRLLCLVRGHRPVRIIDRVEVEEDPFGVFGRITASHRECRRCRRSLPPGASR